MKWLDRLQPFILAFSMYMMVYMFLFQPTIIKGKSMQPTLADNDRLVSNKIIYELRKPERGEIVVVKSPVESGDIIKRVIGLPSETITLENSSVVIDGQEIDEPYLAPHTITEGRSFLRNNVPYKIPEHYYFVMGDNRPFSLDSRIIGPIHEDAITSKAWFWYWPPTKIGLVGE